MAEDQRACHSPGQLESRTATAPASLESRTSIPNPALQRGLVGFPSTYSSSSSSSAAVALRREPTTKTPFMLGSLMVGPQTLPLATGMASRGWQLGGSSVSH